MSIVDDQVSVDLDALIIRRRPIKASCTRIKNWVEANVARDPDILAQLLERKEKSGAYWEEYNLIQSRIEALFPSEEADRESFENAYFALTGKIRNIIEPQNNRISNMRDSTNSERATSQDSDSGENREQSIHMRLPKLNLPTFSGKYEDWLPFHNIFLSVIDGNNSLSNIQKFQYLHASLKGDAASVIHSLELSDENYSEAWSLLRKRYDNSRIIVQTHIREILELPSMTKENCNDLREMVDQTRKHVRALTSLKRPVDKWDDILVFILTSKLDTTTTREWQSSLKSNDLPPLTQLLDFITHKYQALEVSNKGTALAPHSNAINQSNFKRHSITHVATYHIRCFFCRGEHPIFSCKEFLKLPIPMRIKEIQTRKLCINCLRISEHSAGACPSGVCKICSSKHNSLLHISSSRDTTLPHKSSAGEESSSDNTHSSIISNHASVYKSYVMLSTALVYAYDHQGKKKACRLLLDCGSQANFASRTFIRSLAVPTKPLEVLVSGIGQLSTVANEGARIKLQSRTNTFTTEIDCIITDQISDRLPSISFRPNDIRIPHNVTLDDPNYYKSSEVDVLIGADLFWQLICVAKSRLRHSIRQFKKLSLVGFSLADLQLIPNHLGL